MDGGGRTQGPEGLLEHAAWARRLARSLVADEAAADDAVQEAWLAATRRPPQPDRPARPWLGRVLRNALRQRARGEGRRAAREVAAARPEALPGPDELVERLDSQRALAEELARLPEPFRSTVLMRYLEEIEPAEIARRQGLPAGTVRWRLKRGLDELRVRLDARFGDRRRWALLLVPLARTGAPPVPLTPGASAPTATLVPTGGSAALTGAWLVNTSLKVAAGLAAVVVVGAGLVVGGVVPLDRLPWPGASAGESTAQPLQPPAGEPQVEVAHEADGSAEARTALELPRDAPAAPPTTAATTMHLRAGVFDAGGAPLAGGFLSLPAREDLRTAPSGPDGGLELAFEPRADERRLTALVGRAGYATRPVPFEVEPGASVHLGNLRLEPGGSIRGRVLDSGGHPVAGALVSADEAGTPVEYLEMRRYRASFRAWGSARTRSLADGSFVLDGVEEGFRRVWAGGEGWLAGYADPVVVHAGSEVAGVEVRLEPMSDALQVRGVVLDPDGQPVASALLDYGLVSGRSSLGANSEADDQGRFRFVLQPGQRMDLTAGDPRGELGSVSVQGLVGGQVDLELRLVRLLEVALEVRSSGGEPVERFDAFAWASRAVHGRPPPAAQEAGAHPGGRASVRLPNEELEIQVRAPGYALWQLGPLQPGAVGDSLDVVLDPLPGLRGRVLADGRPLAGAQVELHAGLGTMRIQDPHGFSLRAEPFATDVARTDEDGRFLLTPREARCYHVRVEHEGFAPAEAGPLEVDPAVGSDGLTLALTEGGAIEGRVLVPPGPGPEGTLVGISNGLGRARTQRAGADGTFRFEHVTPGPWQVRAVDDRGFSGVGVTQGDGDEPQIPWDCRVEEGSTTRFDLDLGGAGLCTLAGELRFDGRPPGLWTAYLSQAHAVADHVELDPDGRFELQAQQPGIFELSLSGGAQGGGQRSIGLDIELDRGIRPWHLDVATGSLSITGLPTDAPYLSCRWSGPDGLRLWIPLEPDEHRACRVDGVPAGEVGIVRHDPGAAGAGADGWVDLTTVLVRAGDTLEVVLP